MADVQLEHGYLRIANALEEATFYADFSGAQLKIVRCLIRLTYGWQQRTVCIARPDIAKRCRLSATGGFNRALDELLRNRVIIEVSPPTGRCPATYAVNKDFEHWGEYSVPSQALETLFSERPDSGRPTLAGGSTERSPTLQGGRDQPCGVVVTHPLGLVKNPQSVADSAVRPPERQERQERHTATTTHAENPSVVLVAAANAGITDRYGEQPLPLRADAATTLRAVEELTAAGVPTLFARDVVFTSAKRLTLEQPPKSLRYFVPAAVEQWRLESQRRVAETLPPPSERPTRANGNGGNGRHPAVESTEDAYARAARELEQREAHERAPATPATPAAAVAACVVPRKRHG